MDNKSFNVACNYIEAVCVGKPLDLPEYNEGTEQWEVHPLASI